MATTLVCVPASSAKGRELLSTIAGIGAPRRKRKKKIGATKTKKRATKNRR